MTLGSSPVQSIGPLQEFADQACVRLRERGAGPDETGYLATLATDGAHRKKGRRDNGDRDEAVKAATQACAA